MKIMHMTNLILINKNKIMNKIILFFKSMNLLYIIQKRFLNYNYFKKFKK